MATTWQHRLVQRILKTSSAIHVCKERFSHAENSVIGLGLRMAFLEFWLTILSVPAYFFVERDAIVATFADHPDDVVRYRARQGLLSSKLPKDPSKNK